MVNINVVEDQSWEEANERMLALEKEATRASDQLAAQRRRQPAMKVPGKYTFIAEGHEPQNLTDLFDGREQLIVYHAMLAPGSTHLCEGCHMFLDNLGKPQHLNARNTTMVAVSPGEPETIAAARDRLGIVTPWYSTYGHPNFNADLGAGDGFGLSVFIRDGDEVLRTYYTSGRGVEKLGTNWSLLDLTPLGRQEQWEDSPAGWPQEEPYAWWRLNDSYT